MKRARLLILPLALLLAACTTETLSSDDDDGGSDGGDGGSGGAEPMPGPQGLPILGWFSHIPANVDVQVIATDVDGLNAPRDLAFNPLAPDELWVVNYADDSVVVLSMSGQPSSKYNGSGNNHFLSHPSAIAFSSNGNFATAQEEELTTQPSTPADFMGPTLWSSNRTIFDGGHAGHLDMLHNSPSAMGIAWERDNVFWVFDGYHSSLSRYDFQSDHGPGGADHSDGIMTRYAAGEVARQPQMSSHMVFDHASNNLYISDSANGRIAVLNTMTGVAGGTVMPNFDGGQQTQIMGAELTTLVGGEQAAEIGLYNPSGLEIRDNHIFVVDTPSSTIFAFTMEGVLVDWLWLGTTEWSLQGIAFDDAGNLYAVDNLTNSILRITPKEQPAATGG